MLSVSTIATWSRTAVIHARCDWYFWAFAAHFFFSTTSIGFITPRDPLRTKRSADSGSR